MADDDDLEQEFSDLSGEVDSLSGDLSGYDLFDEVSLYNDIYYLTILWADMHVEILSPYFGSAYPPQRIEPGKDEKTGEPERMFPIFDYGDHFSTSVDDLAKGTRATQKYLNTIQKMMGLVIERAKSSEVMQQGEEISEPPEIRLAFTGHEIGQRKAFKECIMSGENISVINFEPGEWGERQLRTMEFLAERGYLAGV